MEIGKIIKEQRLKNNISISNLAKKIGCTERAIFYWESGERSISLENADKILKELNITLTIGKNKGEL